MRPGLWEEVIADFYGGETLHGRELRLHSGIPGVRGMLNDVAEHLEVAK